MPHPENGRERKESTVRILTPDPKSKERIDSTRKRVEDLFMLLSGEDTSLTNYEFAMSLWLSTGSCLGQDLMSNHDVHDSDAKRWVDKYVYAPAEGASMAYAERIGVTYDP